MAEWIENGGPIMKVLIVFNCIGWGLMLWKTFSLIVFNRNLEKHKSSVLSFFENSKVKNVELSASERLELSLFHFMEPYYSGLNTIRIIASIAPLLGLLGTVVGILNSFTVIADKGLENPGLFAEGISLALITTVAGLVVAIPHFIGHNYLKSFLSKSERKLEKVLVF